jgi:predicted nucleic acid-binding Zn ribbon protein
VSRSAPRPLTTALGGLTRELSPASTLARVQELWGQVAGPAIALAAQPTAEREGVLTVGCESSVWAQELTLMQGDLLNRLNAALGGEPIRELRCRVR